MATSGAMVTSNKYINYTISITQNSQSIENNNSNVTVSVRFYRTNTGYTTYGTGKVYCRINGTLYSADVTPSQKITNGGIVLFTKQLNIPHNADGSKTLSVSAWIDHNAPLSSNEQSYSQKLTTIPRVSKPTLSASSVNFGGKITIYTNRQSSGFNHHLYYSINGSGQVGISGDVGASYEWTVPLSLMSKIPNATKTTITFTLYTFSGSTNIGYSTVSFTVNVPSTVKPSCSIQVLDATDTKDKYGNLVKGLSKLYVKTTPTTAYGSGIKTYYTKVTITYANGSSFYKDYYGAEITTPVLWGAGTVKVETTVTDNRGRKSSVASASFPVLDYSPPTVTSLVVHRCNEDGVENDQGEYCEVRFSAVITALNNKNSATYVLSQTNNTTGETRQNTLTSLSGNYSVSNYAYIFGADSGSSYTVTITATDDIQSVPLGTTVSTAFTLYNCHKNGTGWAFGKVAEEENTLENALELRQIANSYAFQPSSFSGEKGYTLLASIQLKQLNVNAPIVFVINRRGALCPMTVYIRFASSSTTTDPDLASIAYEGDNFGAFLYKAGTSSWKLYVDNSSGWSNPCLQSWYTTDNQNDRISVTFPSEQVATLPTPYWRATPAPMRSLLDYIYPVGSIYFSYSHVSPADLFGGTWERIKNAFLWAVDESGTIGQTGGEKTHTLTIAEMPTHQHTYQTPTWKVAEGIDGNAILGAHNTATSQWRRETGAMGGGAAHNNMPPYIQVSAWRRTA